MELAKVGNGGLMGNVVFSRKNRPSPLPTRMFLFFDWVSLASFGPIGDVGKKDPQSVGE